MKKFASNPNPRQLNSEVFNFVKSFLPRASKEDMRNNWHLFLSALFYLAKGCAIVTFGKESVAITYVKACEVSEPPKYLREFKYVGGIIFLFAHPKTEDMSDAELAKYKVIYAYLSAYQKWGTLSDEQKAAHKQEYLDFMRDLNMHEVNAIMNGNYSIEQVEYEPSINENEGQR